MSLPQSDPRQVIISGKVGGIDSSQSLNKTLKTFKQNPREGVVIFVSSDEISNENFQRDYPKVVFRIFCK